MDPDDIAPPWLHASMMVDEMALSDLPEGANPYVTETRRRVIAAVEILAYGEITKGHYPQMTHTPINDATTPAEFAQALQTLLKASSPDLDIITMPDIGLDPTRPDNAPSFLIVGNRTNGTIFRVRIYPDAQPPGTTPVPLKMPGTVMFAKGTRVVHNDTGRIGTILDVSPEGNTYSVKMDNSAGLPHLLKASAVSPVLPPEFDKNELTSVTYGTSPCSSPS